MAEPRYRAAPAGLLLNKPLDMLTAVFHRASGITHLLAEPAPEVLAALGAEPLTQAELLASLERKYELTDADGQALSARLDELVAAGLIEAV